MLHESNPALVTLKHLRDTNKLSLELTVKHLGPGDYRITDNEGVSYGSFNSYINAKAAISTIKDK